MRNFEVANERLASFDGHFLRHDNELRLVIMNVRYRKVDARGYNRSASRCATTRSRSSAKRLLSCAIFQKFTKRQTS